MRGGGRALYKEMCGLSQDPIDLNQDQEPDMEKSGSKVCQAERIPSTLSPVPKAGQSLACSRDGVTGALI